MNFYSRYLFPWFLDRVMSKTFFQNKRKEVLALAKGKVLEIGLGTGLNLAEYPDAIKTIVTVDVNPGLSSRAQRRSKLAKKRIEHHVITAEKLPMADETFDTVVSTWTLCSIPKVEQALQEIHRVLKPGGIFIFVEHGLSNRENVQKWQQRLTPIWKLVVDGCHLDRNVKKLISALPFEIVHYKEFEAPQMRQLVAHMYQGVAMKKEAFTPNST